MALLRFHQFRSALANPIIHRLFSSKVITLEVDASDDIDNFTSTLMQKKSNKWALKFKRKIKENTCNIIVKKTPDVNITLLSTDELNKAFGVALEDGNNQKLENLINQCIDKLQTPSFLVLIQILDISSRSGNLETITKIKSLVKETDPGTYERNGKFNHYLAEVIWLKGDTTKSLEIFELVYRKNIYLRRRIRLMLRYLILDVTNRSEAVLVNLVKFSERILKEHLDFFPLACVWQACFMSEWFTDQMLALELLERNYGLCKAVTNNIPYVVSVSLRGHQTEAIYRLLEILLKYDMKMQYSIVLIALFEYKYRQGDLKSCSEIMQWSLTHEVMLPTALHERFLMLLLNKTEQGRKKKPKPPNYQFKF